MAANFEIWTWWCSCDGPRSAGRGLRCIRRTVPDPKCSMNLVDKRIEVLISDKPRIMIFGASSLRCLVLTQHVRALKIAGSLRVTVAWYPTCLQCAVPCVAIDLSSPCDTDSSSTISEDGG